MLYNELSMHHRYDLSSPAFEAAFSFLRRSDLTELDEGEYPVCPGVTAYVQRYTTSPAEALDFETHNKYFDIQYVVSGLEAIGVVDKVREIMRVAQEPVSLETPIGEEEDSHLGDFIPDDEAPAPADAASHTLLRETLGDVLDSLTPREEKVLRLRFGLEDGRSRTLEEVGKEFNVTRERIRQIEAKALRKLRHPSRSKKLKDFLD